MTLSIRLTLVLAIASILSISPRAAVAQSLTTLATVSTNLVATSKTCPVVTPVVHAMTLSVPSSGSGAVCTNDTQCTGTGEYCGFELNATSGNCKISGLLERSGIHYVAGNLVDADVTVPQCTTISEVNGVPLGGFSGSGGDVPTATTSWSFLGSSGTTVNGVPAIRYRIRVQTSNFGDGQTAALTVKVAARTGGATTTRTLTLANVAAVNAAMRTTVAETRIRNDFVTSMYEKFGDYDQFWEADGTRVYGLNWAQQSVLASPTRYRGTDIRIRSGQVTFSMQFKVEKPGCNPTVFADGSFRLVPGGDGVNLQWIIAPRVEVNASGICAAIPGYQLLTDLKADEAAIAAPLAKTLSAGFGADEDGHIQVCIGCRVVDVRIGGGKIDIMTVPPAARVRVNVSTTTLTDKTANPNAGLLLPAGMRAPIVAGGTHDSCQASIGQSPATCTPKFALDGAGLFNWWGSDVPVPSPIAYSQTGVAVVLGGRQNAWARLQGLTRDVAKLPSRRFPAGALLARRNTTNLLQPTTRALVENGCVMPPNPTAAYRVSLGVNDIAQPVTGAPPTSGKLEATVLIAADKGQSEVLFGSQEECVAETLPTSFTTGGVATSR